MLAGASSAARLTTTPPRLWPTSTQPGCSSASAATKRAQDSSVTPCAGEVSAPMEGRSGATTRAPPASSSGVSLRQHQAPCQAPWTRMKVAFTAADDTGKRLVAEHAARGREGARGELLER